MKLIVECRQLNYTVGTQKYLKASSHSSRWPGQRTVRSTTMSCSGLRCASAFWNSGVGPLNIRRDFSELFEPESPGRESFTSPRSFAQAASCLFPCCSLLF